MTELELYLLFRQELDKICVPEIMKLVQTIPIKHEEKLVGILCATPNYIDCVYVLPEYRRIGLAKKAVIDFYKESEGNEIRLYIINKNKPAFGFWNGLFKLEEIKRDKIDGLDRIIGRR